MTLAFQEQKLYDSDLLKPNFNDPNPSRNKASAHQEPKCQDPKFHDSSLAFKDQSFWIMPIKYQCFDNPAIKNQFYDSILLVSRTKVLRL